MFIRWFIVCVIGCMVWPGNAQELTPDKGHFGGRVGVQLTIGQPVKRLGVVLNLYYQRDWVQFNTEWQGYRNFSSYGPNCKSWESRTSLGVMAAVGDTIGELNPFIDVLFHQTRRAYAVGYTYHYYRDNQQTSQSSGSIALHFKRFYLLTENDVFGSFKGYDNFRTGAFAIGYQHDRWLYELMTILWTGRTRGPDTHSYRGQKAGGYPARWGYRDISKSQYGQHSHGIVGGQVQYALPYGQVGQVAIGFDDERVRNVVQNKIIHDMYFFPPEWTTVRNLHLPMLDCEGNAFCFQKDQVIRPTRLFYKLGLNGSRFY